VKDVGKSTYGDRVRIGVRKDADGKQLVYFRKNGNIVRLSGSVYRLLDGALS
jgi:flavin reductase (DIM6/NTAB) family NADH-FMN oxidoreductase RutF